MNLRRLGGPGDGGAVHHEAESSGGLASVDVLCIVGVAVAGQDVEVLAVAVVGQAKVLGAAEVAKDALGCDGMMLRWCAHELGEGAHSKGKVWTSAYAEVHEGANDALVPADVGGDGFTCLIERGEGCMWDEWCCNGFALVHAEAGENGLGESFLEELDGAPLAVVGDLDAEDAVDGAVVGHLEAAADERLESSMAARDGLHGTMSSTKTATMRTRRC